MKKMKLAALALALVGIFSAGNVLAASDTNTLTIDANVVGTCKFIDSTSSLDLSDLPFDANGISTGTSGDVDVDFWCTKGTGYTISDSSANSNTLKGLTTTTESIAYTRTLSGDTTGGGLGATTTLTVNVDVAIAAGAYDTVSAQAYQDVVTLSFTP
jgi:hypothetical protein